VPSSGKEPITALVAEDDDADFMLLERALTHADTHIRVRRARDGVEAMEYMKGDGAFANRMKFPQPDLVLLDLKMPRMSGFDFLTWIHENPGYAVIPTIVMSNSQLLDDVQRAYRLGANTYFLKPSSFEELSELCEMIGHYWARAVIPESIVSRQRV
jgi:CheY-like chemotaxis protein